MKLRDYPTPVKRRSGCKVAWRYYNTLHDATRCSTAAKYNARIKASQSYDFGYQSPGAVRHVTDSNSEYVGLYEVVIP